MTGVQFRNIRGARTLSHVILGLSLAVVVVAAAEVRANPQVYDKAVRSTAWVVSPTDEDSFSWGGGVLLDLKRRWVLTNYHVVEDRDEAVIFFPVTKGGKLVSDPKHYMSEANRDKLGIPARVIARDQKRDLAVLELKGLPEGIPDMKVAAQSPKPGETVHAIGNSGLREGTLWRYSRGEVRQVYQATFKSKLKDGPILEIEALVVETQAPTNSGDSGGPVVNDKGELVALTQSHDPKGRLVTYSIDGSEIKAFLRGVVKESGAGGTHTHHEAKKPAPKEGGPEEAHTHHEAKKPSVPPRSGPRGPATTKK